MISINRVVELRPALVPWSLRSLLKSREMRAERRSQFRSENSWRADVADNSYLPRLRRP